MGVRGKVKSQILSQDSGFEGRLTQVGSLYDKALFLLWSPIRYTNNNYPLYKSLYKDK